eukprot:538222-Amphidinium_carterae.1
MCVLQRMQQQQIPKLHDSCLGLVGSQFLLERGLFTIASHHESHVLRLSQASTCLREFVRKQQEILASMPRAWFRPFSEHAKSLFELPVRYHSAETLQMLVQIKAIHGHGRDVGDGFARAMAQWEHSGLDIHPLSGWLRKGAPYTRHMAFNLALQHGWVKIDRGGKVQWKSWECMRSLIKRLHSTHEQVAKDALTYRLNYTCVSLDGAMLRKLKRGC